MVIRRHPLATTAASLDVAGWRGRLQGLPRLPQASKEFRQSRHKAYRRRLKVQRTPSATVIQNNGCVASWVREFAFVLVP